MHILTTAYVVSQPNYLVFRSVFLTLHINYVNNFMNQFEGEKYMIWEYSEKKIESKVFKKSF